MPEESKADADDASPHDAPGGHGIAALLLVEALLHRLIEQGYITAGAAAEVTGTAGQILGEMRHVTESPALTHATALLTHISASLTADLVPPNHPAHPKT